MQGSLGIQEIDYYILALSTQEDAGIQSCPNLVIRGSAQSCATDL